jgi:pimeloyl-ACP methyl ester carboxylesterase
MAIAILGAAGWCLHEWYDGLPNRVVIESRSPSADDRHQERRLGAIERVTVWRPGFDQQSALLAGGALLLLWGLGGSVLNRRLFLTRDPRGVPTLDAGKPSRLKRPDGTELHVEVHGPEAAPTVVLTHGWGTDRNEWAYLKREWGDKFRLVVWDLPGLGQSSRPSNQDFSLEKMATDLKAVVEFSGPQPVVLIGHSIGGMITLTFCRLFPELLGHSVSRLVIVHSSYTNPLRTMSMRALMVALQKPLIEPLLSLQIALSPLVRAMNWLSYLNGSIHNSTARDGFGGTESRQQLDFVARFSLKASPAVVARGCFGMLRYDATETLKAISIPVLVVGGDHDPITAPDASQRIATDIPSARLQMLKPAKHYGMIEHVAAFAGSTAAFCIKS